MPCGEPWLVESMIRAEMLSGAGTAASGIMGAGAGSMTGAPPAGALEFPPKLGAVSLGCGVGCRTTSGAVATALVGSTGIIPAVLGSLTRSIALFAWTNWRCTSSSSGAGARENSGADRTHCAPPIRSAPIRAILSWRRGLLRRRLRLSPASRLELAFFFGAGFSAATTAVGSGCSLGSGMSGTSGSGSGGSSSLREESGFDWGPATSSAWLSGMETAAL